MHPVCPPSDICLQEANQNYDWHPHCRKKDFVATWMLNNSILSFFIFQHAYIHSDKNFSRKCLKCIRHGQTRNAFISPVPHSSLCSMIELRSGSRFESNRFLRRKQVKVLKQTKTNVLSRTAPSERSGNWKFGAPEKIRENREQQQREVCGPADGSRSRQGPGASVSPPQA